MVVSDRKEETERGVMVGGGMGEFQTTGKFNGYSRHR